MPRSLSLQAAPANNGLTPPCTQSRSVEVANYRPRLSGEILWLVDRQKQLEVQGFRKLKHEYMKGQN